MSALGHNIAHALGASGRGGTSSCAPVAPQLEHMHLLGYSSYFARAAAGSAQAACTAKAVGVLATWAPQAVAQGKSS